ncbi:MAG: divalent metal cation transporter [Planctomycetota bacterium]
MSETNKVEQDRAALASVEGRGFFAKLGVFTKLSGPGWLQSAITLGGGSLAGSLYIGVIGGYDMLWLQPMMMILGIVMLSAIAYVTLSTGERPFHAINKHINPVLGWGWLFAAMIANLVWAMPQFSLGTAAMQQNLGLNFSNEVCVAILFIIAAVVIWFYDAGGWGIKLFEILLKILVAFIVLAFFAVVIALATRGQLNGGAVFAGFIPDFSLLSKPAAELRPFIEASSNPDYWTGEVVSIQRNTMIAAAATAVGINMTFLLPYSMLRKGWDKTFRGLATFDLSTGLFIPFLLATSCVVIAAASQFHAQAPAIEADTTYVEMENGAKGNLTKMVEVQDTEAFSALKASQREHDKKIEAEEKSLFWEKQLQQSEIDKLKKEDPTLGLGAGPLDKHIDANSNLADKQLSVMVIKRDAGALAGSLEQVFGNKTVSQYIFGLGVVGMAISTIIILMLINGFTFTEALGVKNSGVMHRVGSYLPAFTGAFGFLFLWGAIPEAKFWLAVPTSRIGMILLPVAYLTFFLMMNNKRLMGDNMLQGGKRLIVNTIMVAAILVSGYGCAISLWETNMPIPGMKDGGALPHTVRPYLMTVVGVFIGLAIIVQIIRLAKPNGPSTA